MLGRLAIRTANQTRRLGTASSASDRFQSVDTVPSLRVWWPVVTMKKSWWCVVVVVVVLVVQRSEGELVGATR